MKYKIKKIDREVELDDELVSAYEKVREIRENTFVISLCLRYGDKLDEVNEDELSEACNKALVDDLEAMKDNALVQIILQRIRRAER